MQEKVVNILRNSEPISLSNLIEKLNIDGIISDEDQMFLSSTMVENWTSDCDLFLVERGYMGSTLKIHGKFYPSHGAVYVLFDESRHTYDTANKYMDDHVKNPA